MSKGLYLSVHQPQLFSEPHTVAEGGHSPPRCTHTSPEHIPCASPLIEDIVPPGFQDSRPGCHTHTAPPYISTRLYPHRFTHALRVNHVQIFTAKG